MEFPTKTLRDFGKNNPVPDYVKTAGTNLFANLHNPKTKAEVYLRKFAELTGEKINKKLNLEKRAEILGISADLHDLEHAYSAFTAPVIEKVSEPAELYPVRNKDECLAAVKWLKKNAYAIATPDRRELAERIIKVAAEQNLDVDGEISVFAGHGIGDGHVLADNFRKRAELIRGIYKLHDKETKEATAKNLETLAAEATKFPTAYIEVEELNKIAEVLQFLDNEYGFQKHYETGFLDKPDNACFVHSNKTAEEAEKFTYKLAEYIYDVRDFEKIALSTVVDVLGAEFAEAMSESLQLKHTKIAEALDVMTELEKVIFIDLLKEANVKPLYQVKDTVDLKALTKEIKNLSSA